MSNAFSKLCKCKKCMKTMKYKKREGLYCCSTYDNYGREQCDRIIVKEEFLKSLIFRRFRKEMTDQEIREVVDYVIVQDYLLLELHFKSTENEPILLHGSFVQF